MADMAIDHEQKLTTITVEGNLGLQEMLELLGTMHAHPKFDGSYRVLCDYSACNWAPMLEEFHQHEHSVVDLINNRQPQGPVAFVLKSETERQIMEQVSRDHPWGTVWATFTAWKDAQDWLLAQPA